MFVFLLSFLSFFCIAEHKIIPLMIGESCISVNGVTWSLKDAIKYKIITIQTLKKFGTKKFEKCNSQENPKLTYDSLQALRSNIGGTHFNLLHIEFLCLDDSNANEKSNEKSNGLKTLETEWKEMANHIKAEVCFLLNVKTATDFRAIQFFPTDSNSEPKKNEQYKKGIFKQFVNWFWKLFLSKEKYAKYLKEKEKQEEEKLYKNKISEKKISDNAFKFVAKLCVKQ